MTVPVFVMPYILNISKFCRNLIFVKISTCWVHFFFRQPLLYRDSAVIGRGICGPICQVFADYAFRLQ